MNERYQTRGSEALNRRATVRQPGQPLERHLKKRPIRQRGQSVQLNYERYTDPRYAPSIHIFGFFPLALAVLFFIYSCISFLGISDKIATINDETKAIFSMAQKAKSENDNKENKIYAQVNLEEIREKALTELGMVYPYKNDVMKYQAVSGGYVRQFGELSGKKNLSLFEKVLSMFAFR